MGKMILEAFKFWIFGCGKFPAGVFHEATEESSQKMLFPHLRIFLSEQLHHREQQTFGQTGNEYLSLPKKTI